MVFLHLLSFYSSEGNNTNSVEKNSGAEFNFRIPSFVPVYNVSPPPLPAATITGTTTVCQNDASPLITFTGSDGTAPYTFTYNINGGSPQIVTTTSGNSVTVAAPTTTDGTFIYNLTLIEDDLGDSQAATGSATITVNPTPSIDAISDQVVCNGDPSTAINFSGTATSYSWTNNNTSIGLAGSGTGSISSFTATNSGSSPVTASITVTPIYSNGGVDCPGTAESFTITVNPTPSVNAISNQVICNGDATTAINFSGTATSYNWTNDDTSIGLAASGTGNIASFTATNSGSSPVTATITVTPIYTNGGVDCPGAAESFTIIVNPTPTVNAISNQVICNGDATTAINFSGTANSYNWTNDDTSIGLAASGTGNIASFTATNSGSSPVTASITVTPIYSNGGVNCPGTAESFTITVNPTPSINAISDQVVCNGDATTAINFSGTATSYNWTNDDTSIGLAASGTGNIAAFSASNSGSSPVTSTITVTPIYSNGGVDCPGTAESFTITVNPTPSVNAISDQVVCNGDATTAINFSGTATSDNWTNDDTSIGLAASGTGNIASFSSSNSGSSPVTASITVTPIYTNGGVDCPGTAESFTITVNPTPTVDAVADQVLCNGDATTDIIFSGTATSFSWTNDNPSIGISASSSGDILSFSATNLGTSTEVANITVTPHYTTGATTCDGVPQTFSITVYPTPVADNPGNQTYCQLETTSAIPLTGTPSGVVFDVTGGSSIGISNLSDVTEIPSFLAITSGSATLTVTPKANGCTGTPINFDFVITEIPLPQSNPSARTICSGESTNVLLGSTTPGTTYTWEITSIDAGITGASNGSGDEIDQILSNSSGITGSVTYLITAFANSCEGGKISVTITVHPEVDASISGDATVCQTDVEPVITFTATGGTAPYTFIYNINGGADQQVTTSSGNSATINAATDVDGIFNYNLTSVSGSAVCYYTINETATVTVSTLPTLSSTLTPSGICSNESFNYTPTSDTPGTTFSWSRAVVSGISNPAETGTDDPDEILVNTTNDPIAVTYTYSLETPAGCTNTQDVTVIITPTPILTSSDPSDPICAGETFSYTPSSNVTSGVNYSWTRPAIAGNPAASGTGSINEVLINNTGSNVGITYTYTLSSNDCSNPVTYDVPIVVVPAPDVTASASETIICPGESINLFSSTDITSTQPPTLLSEDFNSASVGSTSGPNDWTTTNSSSGGNNSVPAWTIRPDNYTTAGSYYRTINSNDNSQFYLSDSDAQGSGTTTNVTLVSPKMNTTGYTSLQLEFYHYFRFYSGSSAYVDVSTDGSNWTTIETYNFSQGSSSSFDQETISLNGYIGNTTFYIRFRYVATWGYYWAIDNIEVTGTPSATADVSWTSSPAGFTSTDEDPTNVSPTETTTYTVTYTDPDSGCDGSESVTVTVRDTPDATINADYCAAAPKIRLTTTAGYASYDWEPLPLGETDGNNYIDIEIAGIYSVTVTDANGCTGTASINVSNEYVTNGSFTDGNTGFSTPATGGNQYTYIVDNPSVQNELWPEGLYGIGNDANDYHTNFWGFDHTDGSGSFMIVNGFPGSPQPTIWEQEITGLEQNTTYYFSAWAISLNSAGNDAQLQFSINGTQLGTIADLTTIPGVSNNSNSWQPEGRFYGTWNSGTATSATLSIVDLQTAPAGNDFGLDDISFGVLDPSPAEIDSISVNEDVCSGENIELISYVNGGKEPITYLWTGPNGFSSTDANPIITPSDPSYPGTGDHTYTLNINDWYGCSIDPQSITLTMYSQASADAGADQAVCSVSPDITINGTIGGAASSSTWSTSGTGTFDNAASLTTTYSPSADDISAGSVLLSLTTDDPSGPCPPAISSMTLTINPSPIVTIDINNPTCTGIVDGEATANVSSGTGPFDFLWSDGQTTPTATNLDEGTYSVTVTDAVGCITTVNNIEITDPEILILDNPSYTSTSPSCYGGSDGTATIQVTGGTPPYVFEWIDVPGIKTNQTATGLSDGIYWFNVTDANACNKQVGFAVVVGPEDTELICPLTPTPVQAAPLQTTADISLTDPIYDASCQTISWTMSGATTVSTPTAGIVPSPYTFNVGTTTVEYTVTNTLSEVQTCTFDVVVLPNDPPDISCTDPASFSTDTDQCTADLTIGLPTVNGGDNINWDWEMTGATVATGTGSIPDPYTFNIGTTTIEWTATNISGTDVCTQTIIVNDDQSPDFSLPVAREECVELINQAIFHAPTTDINPDRPEYYTFESGSTIFDLDPSSYTDNCDLSCGPEIRWRIDFADGTALPDTDPSTYNTGQPSTYGSDILLPGDGVTFTNVIHTITYWIVDCNNNVSAPRSNTITIKPRPNIIKQN